MARRCLQTTMLLLVIGLVACGSPSVPRFPEELAHAGSPLGSSYLLVPLPSEDDGLLGRVLHQPPQPGQTLDEVARPNPCAEHLEAPVATPVAATFEDARELGFGAAAGAQLGVFGFSADAQRATHFFYRLETDKRVGVRDTVAYEACCQQKGCGYGYVSALIHGRGTYAAGEELAGSGSADVIIGSGSAHATLKLLRRREVAGYVAALITVTDPKAAAAIGPLGASIPGVTEEALPDAVKRIYDGEEIRIDKRDDSYVFMDGRGAVLSENEFAERFGLVTGSNELQPFDHHRNLGPALALIIPGTLGASAGAALIGLCVSHTICDVGNAGIDKGLGPLALTLSVFGATAVGLGLGIFVPDRDGDDTEHELSPYDAEIYVTRYNRMLLRKTLRDVRDAQRSGSLRLHLGVGGLSFGGTF